MSKMTPQLHAKGEYVLALPFTIAAGAVYECIAIRSFQDLVKEGVDVYTRYYLPKAIAPANFDADVAEDANIITLASPNQPVIYVPDTYITSYPKYDTVAYSNVVLSISLGALPDALDLTFLKTQLAAMASDVVGVVPTVKTHIAPSTGVITQAQHDALEIARNAAVTNRTTDRAKYLQAQATISAMASKIQGLEDYIKANPVTP